MFERHCKSCLVKNSKDLGQGVLLITARRYRYTQLKHMTGY